jgi:toxin-antitoxin system PIN domain toxin
MSAVYLLDVNVLVALMWPTHGFYAAAQEWAAAKGRHAWATCPMTESGFIRIASNPAFSRDALTPEQARLVLRDSMKDARHRFWPDAISYVDAVMLFNSKLVGHKQITDAYLLGLAIHNGGKLTTFDRSIAALLPPSSPHAHAIECIGG